MRRSNLSVSLALAGIGALVPTPIYAQQQAAPSRVVGSVTSMNGSQLTVKPDAGAPVTFTVSANARILETQPGAKTLAGATSIPLSGIAVGDRVLAALHAESDGSTSATTVIAMKQAAVAEHQQAEEADWQRGVGGLVKQVDAATGVITIASGSRMLTIHTTPQTVVRRYSPDSIKFADTRSSTLAEIRPGDQLRARGQRSPDGSMTADAIVAGTFRNIAGVVISTNVAANTVVVKDLATKKRVEIHVTPESRMHKLPEEMADTLAARLKRSGGTPGQTAPTGDEHAAGWQSPAGESGPRPENAHRGGNELSQMLQRAPALQLSELHKGDAVMIVATEGTPESATAVTLLSGVEPILRASPSASQSMFSASWSLGGGGQDAGAGDQPTQ